MDKATDSDWSIPKDGVIDVPDELAPLFNSVGNQFQFVEFSGKNKTIATAHIVQKAQEFFSNNRQLLITAPNDKPSVATTDAQSDEADHKNSLSWKERVEKEADRCGVEWDAFTAGANWAKEIYEKEQVEPLKGEVEEYSRNLKNAADFGGKLIQEKIALQEENKRLKEALEKIAAILYL